MKTLHIKIFQIVIIATVFLMSCDDKLDIKPEGSIASDVVYGTSEGVINALNGAYEQLAGTTALPGEGGELYGGTSFFFPDLIGDDGKCFWGGTFIEYRNMFNKSLDPTDFTIEDHWKRGYEAINIINNVLANISTVDEWEQARVEGEAKFVRGVIYFDLVRLYALPYEPGGGNSQPGVPLVLEPTLAITDESNVSRNTVEEVYNQVISDLTDAESKLSSAGISSSPDNGGRASVHAAAAFLARVYLQKGDFQNAAQKASSVIESGLYALNSTPLACFNNASYTSEDIYMTLQNETSNAGNSNEGLATFYASLPGMGRGDLNISPVFFEMFEEGDLRGLIDEETDDANDVFGIDEIYYIGNAQNGGAINCTKWGSYDTNIPIIRLAELLLIRAEANFEAGTSTGATPVEDINTIRQRASVSPLDNVTRDDIRLERKRELAWEGQRLHDVRRWKENIDDLPYNAPSLVLPIPQREMDVNPNLVQNPGYVGG